MLTFELLLKDIDPPLDMLRMGTGFGYSVMFVFQFRIVERVVVSHIMGGILVFTSPGDPTLLHATCAATPASAMDPTH